MPALSNPPTRLSFVALQISDRITGEGLGEFDVIVRFGAPEAGRLRTKGMSSLAYRLFHRDGGPAGPDWAGCVDPHAPLRSCAWPASALSALPACVSRPLAPGPADCWVVYHESRRGDPAIKATVAWAESAFARAVA